MSNKHDPLISIIIAVYNPGEQLRACLDSIVNQTYKNLEIILVDDGSTDNSLAICKEYAEKDNRIIVHHKENTGVSSTRNTGIRLSHGDYFSFIDSDDYLELDSYEYMLSLIKKHDADAVNYEHFITRPDGERARKLSDENYGCFNREESMYQLVHHVLFAWNKLFSKKIIKDVLYDEEVSRGEDSLFSIMAFDKCDKVVFDSRPLYHYVQTEDSAVRGSFRTSQLTAVKLIDIYEPFFKEKYPKLYNAQMCTMLNLLTTLYFDMQVDKNDFKKEQKDLVSRYKALYKKVKLDSISRKNKIKLRTFRISPKLFCQIHKSKLK